MMTESITLGTVIGFILFLAIVGVVIAKFYSKAKREVPPETRAKLEAYEDLVENKFKQIKAKLEE